MDFYQLDFATRLLITISIAFGVGACFSLARYKKRLGFCEMKIEELERRLEKRTDTIVDKHPLERIFNRMDETETVAEAEEKMKNGQEPIYKLNKQVALTAWKQDSQPRD